MTRTRFTRHLTGSVTFADDILGVIASTARLAASDTQLGAPGTVYAGTSSTWRGLETVENNNVLGDKYTISSDRRTVSFDINTTVMDEMRVVTRATNRLVTIITDSPDPVQAGSDVTYHLAVTSNAPLPAANVLVAEDFPGATLVSATTVSNSPGYDDPNHPIRLRLTFTFNGEGDNLTAVADAYGSTIYRTTIRCGRTSEQWFRSVPRSGRVLRFRIRASMPTPFSSRRSTRSS